MLIKALGPRPIEWVEKKTQEKPQKTIWNEAENIVKEWNIEEDLAKNRRREEGLSSTSRNNHVYLWTLGERPAGGVGRDQKKGSFGKGVFSKMSMI